MSSLHYFTWYNSAVPVTSGQLDDPRDDDDEEGQQLGVGEDVLHGRGPLHLVEWNIFNIRNIFRTRTEPLL